MENLAFNNKKIEVCITRKLRTDLKTCIIIGNFLSSTRGNLAVCEELAAQLTLVGWRVIMETQESIDPTPAGREKLVNTYDNGLRFVVDEFFQVLVSNTRNQNHIILLNNFATLLDLMGVKRSWRIYSYEKSIFELTPEDNEVRFFLNGSLYGLGGNYEVIGIPTPSDEGWGISNLAAKSAEVQ